MEQTELLETQISKGWVIVDCRFEEIFSCGATQYMVLCVRMAVCLSDVRSKFTKLYSPNLCLGKSIDGNVVVWLVCFM